MRVFVPYVFFTLMVLAGQNSLAASSSQFLCTSDIHKNVQIAVDLGRTSIKLLTRSDSNNLFVNNGSFICKKSEDIKINPPKSELLICGDHPVDTGDIVMGQPLYEVPYLQISNGFSYRITFSQRNIFNRESRLEITSNSGQSHSIILECTRI